MLMKKLLLISGFVAVSLAGMAQESISDEKHSVATNSFWANWFVQGNLVGTSFWGSQENAGIKPSKLFKGYRTNLGFSLALGKWFTPGIGLRTKFQGVWGRSVISENKSVNASKYWTLQEQVLLNLSNMLAGYNERRVWNFIPYVGGGIGRNMSYNTYAMGFSVGLLNTFRVSRKLAVNFDVSWSGYESRFDGFAQKGGSRHSWKNKDRMVNVEVGLTYRLGKSTWKPTVAQDAMNALTMSEIDALNAQLADAEAENSRLSELLARQQKAAPEAQPSHEPAARVVSAPVSVFFNLNKATLASRRDLQNVADLIAVARQQGSRLVVTGYADNNTGRAERNRMLSEQRAEALVAEIVKMGFPREKIDIVAAGGVDTLTPAPYNRRATVEIK